MASQRTAFAERAAFTVGVEEEVLLIDEDGEPVPVADGVVARAIPEPRSHTVKEELPPSQLELATEPSTTAREAVLRLVRARRSVVAAAQGLARPAPLAVHPWRSWFRPAPRHERARSLHARYGPAAARQLVSSLQVHVAIEDADLAVLVHDELREHLPWLAALAGRSPFFEGRDTGFASVRPAVCSLLPRQGIPPALRSWDRWAGEVGWGLASEAMGGEKEWWWELRLHASHGTIELRAFDVQPELWRAAALIDVFRALVRATVDALDARGPRDPVPTWRIAEGRWEAMAHGLAGVHRDPRTAEARTFAVEARTQLQRLGPWIESPWPQVLALVDHPAVEATRQAGVRGCIERAVAAFASTESVDGWFGPSAGG